MGRREVNENGTMNAYVIGPDQVQTGDRYGYKIVAVIYNFPFWCCYMGLTDWSDDRVAKEGDTVKKEIAEKLFPSLALERIYND